MERVRELADPVARFWGVYLEVVPATGEVDYAGTDFRQVLVSRRLVTASDAEIRMVLAHEWGHRTLAPVVAARQRTDVNSTMCARR